jgi:hypothetical protein
MMANWGHWNQVHCDIYNTWRHHVRGQLCVMTKFSQNCIFHPIYVNDVCLNGNSTWEVSQSCLSLVLARMAALALHVTMTSLILLQGFRQNIFFFFRGIWPPNIKALGYAPKYLKNTITCHGNLHFQQRFNVVTNFFGYVIWRKLACAAEEVKTFKSFH